MRNETFLAQSTGRAASWAPHPVRMALTNHPPHDSSYHVQRFEETIGPHDIRPSRCPLGICGSTAADDPRRKADFHDFGESAAIDLPWRRISGCVPGHGSPTISRQLPQDGKDTPRNGWSCSRTCCLQENCLSDFNVWSIRKLSRCAATRG